MAKPGQFPSTTLAVAGVPQQLIAMEFLVMSAIIEADEANVGTIYIGDINVTASNGSPLLAGDSLQFTLPESQNVDEAFNMADFWAVGDTNGDKVRVSYLLRREFGVR